MPSTNLILIGFQRAGKTTLGQELALRTGRSFWDSDWELESLYHQRMGRAQNCRDIYRSHGGNYFRRLEMEALEHCPLTASVIALGGGAVLSASDKLLKSGRCLYIYWSADLLRSRMHQRPAYLQDDAAIEDSFAETFQRRHRSYLSCAQQVIDMSNLCLESALERLQREL